MHIFTSITLPEQITNLEGLALNNGLSFKFSLFFKDDSCKHLLDEGNLILFSHLGLVDTGSKRNIAPSNWTELPYDAFLDAITE